MNSPPDGYTLLINTIPFVSNQFLMPRAPYDPLRDFVSISHRRVVALVRHRASVAAGALGPGAHRARQGEAGPALLLGRGRRHQSAHCRRAVQPAGGRQYRGRAVQGRRACRHGASSPARWRSRSAISRSRSAIVKAGRMRALAVTSAKRNPAMPELPTVAEAPGRSAARLRVRYLVRGGRAQAARRARLSTRCTSHIRKVLTAARAGEVLTRSGG